jgi:chromosome segregation ATPase
MPALFDAKGGNSVNDENVWEGKLKKMRQSTESNRKQLNSTMMQQHEDVKFRFEGVDKQFKHLNKSIKSMEAQFKHLNKSMEESMKALMEKIERPETEISDI